LTDFGNCNNVITLVFLNCGTLKNTSNFSAFGNNKIMSIDFLFYLFIYLFK